MRTYHTEEQKGVVMEVVTDKKGNRWSVEAALLDLVAGPDQAARRAYLDKELAAGMNQ